MTNSINNKNYLNNAIQILKDEKAYSKKVVFHLEAFVNAKIEFYTKPNTIYDENFINHFLSNIPESQGQLYLNFDDSIHNIVNKERYLYNQNQIGEIISKAEEAAIREFIKITKY